MPGDRILLKPKTRFRMRNTDSTFALTFHFEILSFLCNSSTSSLNLVRLQVIFWALVEAFFSLLVEEGTWRMVASTIVPVAILMPLASLCRFTAVHANRYFAGYILWKPKCRNDAVVGETGILLNIKTATPTASESCLSIAP